jgi:heme/copper-type cytochrome/quinol oxidase subunit 2
MWERIMDASLLTAGAIVLFAAFTTILVVYEHREEKKKAVRRPPLRVIRCEKTDRAA